MTYNHTKKLEWKNERKKLSDLKPAHYNARVMSETQKADLAASISEFNEIDPIIINSDGTIIGGHMRYQIYLEKGIKEVDVRVPSRPLTKKEEKRANLRLNKNVGSWDYEKLEDFGQEVLEDVGFESVEIDRIFDSEDSEDEYQAEAEYQHIKHPQARHGDIYLLGDHRVMCGSSTSQEDVKRLMGAKKADMVFMDPPYNINYSTSKGDNIMNDDMSDEDFVEFSVEFFTRTQESLKEGGSFYCCSGFRSYVPFRYAIEASGMKYSSPIIWVKNQQSIFGSDYHHKHEMMLKGSKPKKKKAETIMYGWNGGKHYFESDRNESDVWEIKRRASSTMSHPTQKPIEICARAIRNSSKRGEIVLDLFLGSASTLIAAEKEGRICYGMELDPKFVDIAVERWENYTGKTAKKVGQDKVKPTKQKP